MAMPTTASTSRPANTIGTWNGLRVEHQLAKPLFAPTVSDTTAPTKASVIATFSEPKKYGSERGMPTLRMMSSFDAPSARSTSSSSGSVVARPVATLTTIGKNEIRNAVSTAGIADAEPEDQHRHHRHLRDGVEADQHRVDAGVERAMPADRDAERQAEQRWR